MIPAGQLCQAKDKYGPVRHPDGVTRWSRLAQPGCPHPATVLWGDVNTFNHGGGAFWCEHCVLDTQIAHAEERIKALDGLREKRKIACAVHP